MHINLFYDTQNDRHYQRILSVLRSFKPQHYFHIWEFNVRYQQFLPELDKVLLINNINMNCCIEVIDTLEKLIKMEFAPDLLILMGRTISSTYSFSTSCLNCRGILEYYGFSGNLVCKCEPGPFVNVYPYQSIQDG